MKQIYPIFIAIILGSLIIGGFVYLGIVNRPVLIQNNVISEQLDSNVGGAAILQSLDKNAGCQAEEETIITKVIDGDTVVVGGGYHVRLLGLDADEKGYRCYKAAKVRLEELILNKQVKLEKDKTDIDQYKRCLRNIFLGNQNIGLELVKEGLAIARFYEPDVKYKNEIIVAEKQAIENRIGCKWENR